MTEQNPILASLLRRQTDLVSAGTALLARKVTASDELVNLRIDCDWQIVSVKFSKKYRVVEPAVLGQSVMRCYNKGVEQLKKLLTAEVIQQTNSIEDQPKHRFPAGKDSFLAGMESTSHQVARNEGFEESAIKVEEYTTRVDLSLKSERSDQIRKMFDSIESLGAREALLNSPFNDSDLMKNPADRDLQIREQLRSKFHQIRRFQDQIGQLVAKSETDFCTCQVNGWGVLIDTCFASKIRAIPADSLATNFIHVFQEANSKATALRNSFFNSRREK